MKTHLRVGESFRNWLKLYQVVHIVNDESNKYPVLVLSVDENGVEKVEWLDREGRSRTGDQIAPPRSPNFIWLNIYHGDDGGLETTEAYESREDADSEATPDRIGRMKIELQIGFDE